jgi:hypothetical protein
MIKLLNRYKNGNVVVSLYDDGTKIMEYDETKPIVFDFPTSMDIKITNWCNGINGKPCIFCHEQSNERGKHGDLNKLSEILSELPGGQECAIGGGRAQSHPDLIPFLQRCKEQGLIPNLTINKAHLSQDYSLLRRLIDEKLIYGIGISIPDSIDGSNLWNEKEEWFAHYEHSVVHLILGIHTPQVIETLQQLGFKKFLLLGYKQFGRGVKYYKQNSDYINFNIKDWENNIIKVISGKNIISFDNLAIEQLNLQSKLPEKLWEKLFQGEDGSSTCYIDAVSEEYALTSRSPKNERVSWNKMSLFKYFNDNKNKI